MKLIEQYPEFLRNSPEFSDLQAALQPELDGLRARLEDMTEQLDLETATWGLDLWESTLGLVPGRAMGPRARRARIAGKLRGAGTSTVEAVHQVVESFTGGEAEVIERAREFRVELRLRSEHVLDLSHLSAALREMLPAHLTFGLEFTAGEASRILGWGTAAGSAGSLPGTEQARRPPAAASAYAGGAAEMVSQSAGAEQARRETVSGLQTGGSSSLFLTAPGQNAEEA